MWDEFLVNDIVVSERFTWAIRDESNLWMNREMHLFHRCLF